MPSIFKQQKFICGGCGATKVAKVNVPFEQKDTPLAPPPGWASATVVAQHPEFGATAALSIYACSEACAQKLAAGAGPGIALIEQFQKTFAKDATHEVKG